MAVHFTTAPMAVLLAAVLAIGANGARPMGGFAPAPAPGPEGGMAGCPPLGLEPVDNFNVTEYISAPWFVLAQTPLIYQPESQLFCTRATYEPLNPADPLDGLRVLNFAREGSVQGPAFSTGKGPSLVARVPDRSRPSALSVGFDVPGQSQLVGTQFGKGPYWVVLTGDDGAGGYDYAIVMSGAPVIPSPTGCTFPAPMASGIWLFSRTPENDEAYDIMMSALEGWGVSTAGIQRVQQEDCTYE